MNLLSIFYSKLLTLRTKIINKYHFGVIVFCIGNRVFKLFSPHAQKRKILEWYGNQQAQLDPVWEGRVVSLKRIPFGFIMLRGRQANLKDYPIIKKYIINKLDLIIKNDSWVKASEAINDSVSVLKILEDNGFNKNKSKSIIAKLKSFNIPQSSSHGDFYSDNIIFINKKMKIIDWSLYSNESSIILDIMHLPLRKICENNKISWTEAQTKSIPTWNMLARKLNINVNNLRILYVVDRSERELRQKNLERGNVDVGKYIYALNEAINKLEDNDD